MHNLCVSYLDFLLFPTLFCGVLGLQLLPENENVTVAATRVDQYEPQPRVDQQPVPCDTVLVTGWIVSAVLFLVLLFFCLGMAIQSKRDVCVEKMLEEGRRPSRIMTIMNNYFPLYT